MPDWITTLALTGMAGASKAAPALLEKISSAIGAFAEPWIIERRGKAEAKVLIEQKCAEAEGNIQALDIYQRAEYRMMGEQIKQQKNIENITSKALLDLKDTADPSKIDDDWIVNFFSKCRLISDVDMQGLWAKILAGEANAPGAFSKKTISIISDIEKKDANLFTTLCGFCIGPERDVLIVHGFGDSIYNTKGIRLHTLEHLGSLGLVNITETDRTIYMDKPLRVIYFHLAFLLTLKNDQNANLSIGHAVLTNAGRQLCHLSGSQFIPDFVPYLMEKWKEFSPMMVSND